MAIFGDLGKALGLGKTKDVLPQLVGAGVGFMAGGPMGASIGAGIGGLASGKSVNEALTGAALAYGVTSFLPASMGPSGSQSFLNQKLYGDAATKLATEGIQQAAVPVANMSDAALYDLAYSEPAKAIVPGASDTASSGIFGNLFDDIGLKEAALGLSAAGLLMPPPEDEGVTTRPYAGGEAFGSVKGPFSKKEYDIADPLDVIEYNKELQKYQDPDFDYRNPPVLAKSGGAMFGDDDAYGAMLPEKYARKSKPEQNYQHPVGPGDYTGEVSGAGTGTSDSVPAWLSDGEFVLTAKAVKNAGGGDRDIGAARLYDMMAELEATA